ncbi:cytochrome c oxidase accessory protein CcoG [Magnetospirillum gryphiswaldense]|uniref:Iron-sulfur cluster-binding protein n=1 Tax=Magnetospirillum gryphiswaldense TaxID=55518 RepID=A4U0S5_9PROT|nr:cytochrome c oxidase accessory protein CcoG [Magnetospirillum gryphiswaldense]AVM74256.1 Ubp3 associated protein Bre5 [Magnetospirillum gryphiswaldense MSR-1]AVM78159.1 Ubp3 associated protein Bre5 [Magnetospirillum gryphiswaldense]CAM76482.1 iron-sulfur cluster-binding protein [Magnetospirillum gryphiswaldense MSR-1]
MNATIDPDQITERQPTKGEVPFYRENGQAVPRGVKGLFRNLKWWASGILLAWWHLGPFLRWDRGPDAPGQAILLDMAGRRAYFFDIEIWPQEIYYVTGLLLIAAISLFLMSALAGRVWCGFLCWQTVYTDLFQNIERWVIGERTARITFERAPTSVGKLAKKSVVVGAWALVSAACGIGVTLWFGDAFQMLKDIFTLEAPTAAYVFISIIGGFCFLLGGFARERVCVYMCPYSRFQAAMFDEHSLIVSYEAWRGEPRAPAPKDRNFADRGHCVDCKMCVQSCPTGVDIRFGNQLACIGCGVCIDACDQIMDKFGLPRGLISYDSQVNLEAREAGRKAPGIKPIRARTVLYAGLLAIVAGIMLVSLLTRSTTEVNVLHERAPLYVQLSDGSVRNGYAYKILNMVREDRTYVLKTEGLAGATLEVVGGKADAAELELKVEKDQVATYRIFVNVPENVLPGRSADLTFVLTEQGKSGKPIRSKTLFAGPDK